MYIVVKVEMLSLLENILRVPPLLCYWPITLRNEMTSARNAIDRDDGCVAAAVAC